MLEGSRHPQAWGRNLSHGHLIRDSPITQSETEPIPNRTLHSAHEQAHGVSKGHVSCSFKRRTMFPDKFLKPHWLVPRDFLDHLISAGEKTCRMILRDFKDMLCKAGVAPLQPLLPKWFRRDAAVAALIA